MLFDTILASAQWCACFAHAYLSKHPTQQSPSHLGIHVHKPPTLCGTVPRGYHQVALDVQACDASCRGMSVGKPNNTKNPTRTTSTCQAHAVLIASEQWLIDKDNSIHNPTHAHTWMRNQSLLYAVVFSRIAHQHLPPCGASQHGPTTAPRCQSGHYVRHGIPCRCHSAARVQAEGGEAT